MFRKETFYKKQKKAFKAKVKKNKSKKGGENIWTCRADQTYR
jgi:hypothetical protein